MKVLHVYSGNLWGGVERLLVTAARCRGLAPGMEPSFALCFEGRLATELAETGCGVHRLGPVRVRRPWSVRRARRRLGEVLRSGSHDVVICHSAWSQGLFASAARREGVPVVLWLHDAASGKGWVERWARRSRPDLAVCNSRFTAGTLPALYSGVEAAVVHCPVEASPEEPGARECVRGELGVRGGEVVILHASRLQPWKGHDVLLEALAGIRDRTGWTAWIAGGPQRTKERRYLAHLKSDAQRRGIADRVRFLGQREDMPRLLAGADVFCQPNTAPEPFGIVLVEALAAGLPVVTAGMGGALEIVDGSCGTFVEPGDGDGLGAALARLIGDPAERARLGGAGPPRARAVSDPAGRLGELERALQRVMTPGRPVGSAPVEAG